MSEWIGRDRKARRAYGFDEIALVPGDITINPDEVDISLKIGDQTFGIPFLASAAPAGTDDPTRASRAHAHRIFCMVILLSSVPEPGRCAK